MLKYAIVASSSLLLFSTRKAPTPQSLASTWIINDLWYWGKRRTGAEVNNYFTLIKAASCSDPQWFRNVCKFATDLRVRATKGSMIGARFGMNFRTKLTVPRTERSSLIVVGVFKSIMALIRSSPMRIPSADKTCPRY